MITPIQLSVFFAAVSDPIGILDALTIILVVAMLFLAKAVLSLRQRIEELEDAKDGTSTSSGPSPAPAAQTIAAAPGPDAIPAEILAVIAAAVHVALPGNVRIVGVSSTASHTEDRAWSLEGRRQIFGSHKVR